MEPWAVVFYMVLFSTSMAGIVGLGVIAFRGRDRVARGVFFLDLAFGLGLLSFLVGSYLNTVLSLIGPPDPLIQASLSLVTAVALFVTYALVLWLLKVLPKPPRFAFVRPVVRGVWIGVLTLVLSLAALRNVPGALALVPQFPPMTGYVLITLGVSMTGLDFWLTAPSEGTDHGWFLLRSWGLVLMGFLPLTLLETLVDTTHWLGFEGLQLDFVLYFGCNVASLVALTRFLGARPIAQATGPDETLDRWGLTSREAEIIPLIARGLANKEIAGELGISSATVRTHIYNIFQKVGAQSRIGLLNRVGGLNRKLPPTQDTSPGL